MAGHANIPAQSMRSHETGLCWIERITNDKGPVNIKQYSVVRIRAAAPTTITLSDSLMLTTVLACTLAAGEIIRLNVGPAMNTTISNDQTVTISSTGNIYLQEGSQI